VLAAADRELAAGKAGAAPGKLALLAVLTAVPQLPQ